MWVNFGRLGCLELISAICVQVCIVISGDVNWLDWWCHVVLPTFKDVDALFMPDKRVDPMVAVE